jgi:glutamate dehydrogenase
MAVRLAGETRRPISDVAHAFMAAREVFALPALWQRIESHDGKAQGEAQLRLYQATRDLVNEQTQWFLRDGVAIADLTGTIARHKSGLAALAGALDAVLPPRRKAELARETSRLGEGGIPADLASDVARLEVLGQAPAITVIAEATGQGVAGTARIFLDIGERLRIDDLARRGAGIATADQYDRLAIAQALGQLAGAQGAFTREAIRAGGSEAWAANQGDRLARVQATVDEVAGEGTLTVSRLLVAAGQLSELSVALAAPSASARKARTAGPARSAASESPPARTRAPQPRS